MVGLSSRKQIYCISTKLERGIWCKRKKNQRFPPVKVKSSCERNCGSFFLSFSRIWKSFSRTLFPTFQGQSLDIFSRLFLFHEKGVEFFLTFYVGNCTYRKGFSFSGIRVGKIFTHASGAFTDIFTKGSEFNGRRTEN